MGHQFGKLLRSVPAGASVAVISNAADLIPAEARSAYARDVFDPVAIFRSHQLSARDIDLREYFDRSDLLKDALSHDQLVWANGGNVFLLRRAMAQSGLDTLLRTRVGNGSLIYGGWSAGAMVAGPSLRGFELMDDPADTIPPYRHEPIWDGLGLVEQTIVPHVQSDHAESEAAARVVAVLIRDGRLFHGLRDGEVLLV
jgi:dipeptidase E